MVAHTDVGGTAYKVQAVFQTEQTGEGSVTKLRTYQSVDEALADEGNDEHGNPLRIRGSTDLLAGLGAPPRKEVPGVTQRIRRDFRTNLEVPDVPETQRIKVGNVLDNNFNVLVDQPVIIPDSALWRGCGVFGMPGSGKTELMMNIAEELAKRGIVITAISPVKGYELRELAARGLEVRRISPGGRDKHLPPVGLNFFEPEPGTPIAFHAAMMKVPLENIIEQGDTEAQATVRRYINEGIYGYEKDGIRIPGIYERAGWNIETDEPIAGFAGIPPYPTLADLQRNILDIVELLDYRGDAKDLGTWLDTTLKNVRTGPAGDFLERSLSIDMDKLLNTHTILEIENVPSDAERSLIMMALIVRLYEHSVVQQEKRGIGGQQKWGHAILIDESQLLLKEGSDLSEALVRMMREMRAYGYSFILAAQEPSRVHPSALALTDVKFLGKMTRDQDRQAVGAAMGLSSTNERDQHNLMTAVGLKPGRFLFTQGEMPEPLLIQTYYKGPQETTQTLPPDSLVADSARSGYDEELAVKLPSIKERAYAKELLGSPEGRALQTLAEFMTVTTLTGLGDVRLHPDLLARLQVDTASRLKNNRIIGEAIHQAVAKAVGARNLDIARYLPSEDRRMHEELIDHIAARVRAQINGEEKEKPELLAQDEKYTYPFLRGFLQRAKSEIVEQLNDGGNSDTGKEVPAEGNRTYIREAVKMIQKTVFSSHPQEEWTAIEAIIGKGALAPNWLEQYAKLFKSFEMDPIAAEFLFISTEQSIAKDTEKMDEEEGTEKQIGNDQPDDQSTVASPVTEGDVITETVLYQKPKQSSGRLSNKEKRQKIIELKAQQRRKREENATESKE